MLSREDKYKATSFLETFVYRSGDSLWSWAYTALLGLGLTVVGISWLSVGSAVVFLVLGIWLGRRQQQMAAAQSQA